MHEVWRPVTGYNGRYEVSNLGEVRSLERTKRNNGGAQRIPSHVMRQSQNHKGYKIVHLSKDGANTWVMVHRIVALAFIPNPEGKPQVNHIDGDKNNNAANNLEWVTNAENMRHAVENGLNNPWPMLRAAHSKESREKTSRSLQRAVIRSDGKVYESVNDAARDNDVTHGAVSMNIHGKTKKCNGFTFSFVDDGASVAKLAKGAGNGGD